MTLTKTKPRRPTKADQQRVGHHHHRNPHYIKTYWPYLPIIAIVSTGFALNTWLSGLHKNVLGYATDISASSLLAYTNTIRTAHHEPPLSINAQLDQAAQAKADDMAARNYWSHNTPDGKTPWSFIMASGYTYQTAGENLAYGFTTASSVITGWLDSPEHRANLLGDAYRDVGFGVVDIPNYQHDGPQTLVVALYASPASASISALGATTAGMPVAIVESSSHHVARIQLASGTSAWGIVFISFLGLTGLVMLIPRHRKAWHKALVRGEQFVLKHPLLDIVGTTLIMLSIILGHTAGIIR